MVAKAKRVVYAYVVGDLFHRGHLRFLKRAKRLGNYLIVGVLTDEAAMSYKRKPVIPFEERMELVKAMKAVDKVVRQDSLDPTENLKRLENVDILVGGGNWPKDFPGAAYMRSIGRKAIQLPYYPQRTTTDIIEEILRREQYGQK